MKIKFYFSSGQNIPLAFPELVLNICKQCNWIYVFWVFLMCRFDSIRPSICSTTKFSFFWHRNSICENNWTGEADTGKLLNYIYYLDLFKIRVYSLLLIELKKTSKRKKKKPNLQLVPVALRIKTNVLDLAPDCLSSFPETSKFSYSAFHPHWFPVPSTGNFSTCSLIKDFHMLSSFWVFFSPISILNPNSSLSLRHHFSRKVFLVTAAEIQSLWWLLSLSRDYNYTLIWMWVIIWWISFLSDTRFHQARALCFVYHCVFRH